jgi:hypothetical protein
MENTSSFPLGGLRGLDTKNNDEMLAAFFLTQRHEGAKAQSYF